MARSLRFFVAAMLTFSCMVSAKTYYLAPDGSDTKDGLSSANAKFSLQAAVDLATAGDTILMKPGTYNYDTTINITTSGTASAPIYIMSSSTEKAIMNFSTYDVGGDEDIRAYARGMRITGDYWYLKHLEICYAPDNGIKVEGCHNTFDQCIFDHNNDSGIQIGFWKEGTLVDNSSGELCAYNLVVNCDSYRNADATYYSGGSPYENADGFACKLYAGKGNVFRGCRAWENCDDGWDFYMTNFEIRIENCWSYHNGDQNIWAQDSSSWNGDGNGFKLGGDDYPSPNIAINCVAFDAYFGAMCGFNSNNNGTGIRLYNCTAWHCGKNFKMVDQAHTLKNCLAFDPVSGKNFNADLTIGTVIEDHNSWDTTDFKVTPDYSDLVSTSAADFLAARQSDGSLPNNGFGRLAAGSDCIDKGVAIDGMSYSGTAPDLGAYEYGLTTGVFRFSKQKQGSALSLQYQRSQSSYYVNLRGSRVATVQNGQAMASLGSGVYYRVAKNESGKETFVNIQKR